MIDTARFYFSSQAAHAGVLVEALGRARQEQLGRLTLSADDRAFLHACGVGVETPLPSNAGLLILAFLRHRDAQVSA